MARSIGSSFDTQISSNSVRPFFAFKIGYSTDQLRIWTGYHTITIDSEDYIGGANLIDLDSVNESADLKATGIAIGLSGLDSSILSSAISQVANGVPAELYFGVLTTTGSGASASTTVVDTPYLLFEGFLDEINIADTGATSDITFTIENKMVMLEKPIDRRYTDQDQKNLFAGDKGLEFVADIQLKAIAWGGGTR
tara:strand:+ start:248 stop:835 length:588 start_codon:yes stop_codon:yes gene_type:complete